MRNLLRRPGRSALTLTGLTLVVLLIFVVVGFIRGLDATLTAGGDERVVLVHSLGASENVENSSIEEGNADQVIGGVEGIRRRYQVTYSSKEIYLGTRVQARESGEATLGLVRGVTPEALLVRSAVQILEGRWPGADEVLVGRLASTKLGIGAEDLAVGRTVHFDGKTWRISGRFAALGSPLESEIWCPLRDLQQVLKRQSLSLVALKMSAGADPGEVVLFCKEKQTLEMEATPEKDYYAALQRHYRPVRTLAWLVVVLIAGAGAFAGLNTMYGAVVSRVRELATLQAIGFVRRAIALSLVQEAILLAAAGTLVAAFLALSVVNGLAVRFTMGAFVLRIDGVVLLVGCGTGLFLGIIGAVPPAIRAMRLPVAEGLKAV